MHATTTISILLKHFIREPKEVGTADSANLVGIAVNKQFRITEVLGAGETSCLYKGFDRYSNATVLVKVLHKHLATDRRAINRFQDEIEKITPLSYPGIEKVVAKSVLSTGQPYVVMECLKSIPMNVAELN